ncbi:MAG: hypothetical protein Fur0019_17730 [Tibeticola sp.]
MPWWSTIPSLTPVAVWDALHLTPDGAALEDQAGTRLIPFGGAQVLQFPYAAVTGNGNPWPLSSALPMPAAPYVLAAFVRHQRRGMVFCKALNDGWNYWFDQENDGTMYQTGASAYGAVGAGPAFGTIVSHRVV